jgi:hypothetical protein
MTEYAKSLRCDEENCKTPLRIFGQWNDATIAKEREADIATWVLDAFLHCPKGHPIDLT